MLKLGVPSKGRLQKDTISWFKKEDYFLNVQVQKENILAVSLE
jgi:ATP phosphoribosyltransferase